MIVYTVRALDGSTVIEFADVEGDVVGPHGSARSRVDGRVADGRHATVARDAAAGAADGAELRASLRSAGFTVEAADLAGIQVRISATGHPFVPGHSGGVGAHGEIAGKISAAAAAAHKASEHAAQAKHHAFLASHATTAQAALHHASEAETHHAAAVMHASTAAQQGHPSTAAHAGAAQTASAQAKSHADAAWAQHKGHKLARKADDHAALVDHYVEQAKAARSVAEAEHAMNEATSFAIDARGHVESLEAHAASDASLGKFKEHVDRINKNLSEALSAHKRMRLAVGALKEAAQEADRTEFHARRAAQAQTRTAAEAEARLARTANVKARARFNDARASGVNSDLSAEGLAHVARSNAAMARVNELLAAPAPTPAAAPKPAQAAAHPKPAGHAHAPHPSDAAVQRVVGPKGSVNEMLAAFSSPGHFEARFNAVIGGGNETTMYANLHAPDGRKVGTIARKFTKHPNGEIHVYHDYFELTDKTMQGNGASKAVLRQSLDMYERIGVKEITVSAGLTCGRYVWASYGFSARPEEVKTYKAAFARDLRERGYGVSAAKLRNVKTMQGIADFKGSDGEPLGKKWLLNQKDGGELGMWHGTLRVDKADPGYQRMRRKTAVSAP